MKGVLQITEIAAGTAIHAHALRNHPPRSHLHPDGVAARGERPYAIRNSTVSSFEYSGTWRRCGREQAREGYSHRAWVRPQS